MAWVKDYPPYLDRPKSVKPMTKADRIRAMSDEELAEFRAGEHCPPTIRFPDCATLRPCRECWLEWLQQPAEAHP